MSARRLVILMLGLVLASCAPTVKPAGPPIAAPVLSADAIVTADAKRLPLRAWLPGAEPKAVIIALHGFNDYSFAFDDPGKALAARGIAVYAYDQRGFGGAPDRGYWAGEKAMGDDLITAARLIGDRHPGKPLFLMGESMGGAVVMVTMARSDAPSVAGVILSAPAVWGRGSMSLIQQAALWLTSHTMPWLTLTGRGLNIKPSDNIEMLRRLGADPMVIKETRVDAIHGLCDLMDHAEEGAPLHVPTLALYGDKDEVVPAGPIYRVFKALPDIAVKAFYENGHHMLLRDLEAKTVLDDIAAWIEAPRAPLPSGADRHALDRLAEAAGR